MSSTSTFRASQRRAAQNPPSPLSQQPRNAGAYARPSSSRPQQASTASTPLSVEEWEAKAPLGELEIRSVGAIKLATEKAPIPLKFSAVENDDDGPSTPVTPVATARAAPSSRPPTPLNAIVSRSGPHALHPRQPVHTTQQLYDWFALIDRSVTHSQEAHFRAHIATVAEHLNTCDLLLSRVDEIEQEVDSMLANWRSVEEGGKSLKDACERLLEEKDKLNELTDDIGLHLEYFQQLDVATRMLNHPGEQLIYQTDFLYMVEKVDICIEFLKSRRHFKEAEVYLLRFQQCMTRAMTLIKMNFVGSLRALSSDISKRLSEKDVSSTAQMHLLYTRFRSVAVKLAPLLGELERRARSYPDDLSSLLSECHSAYFSARKALLLPKIMDEIRGLDPTRSELVELTRAGCSYLKQLCTDEFDLYREFFSTAEDQLYQYLETLCDLLYDDLRPRILHEPRLTALCEVCTVLQALMVLDAPVSSSSTLFSIGDNNSKSGSSQTGSDDESSVDEDGDNLSELTVDLETVSLTAKRKNKGKLGQVGRRLHIRHLLQMVLQDAQTRLFFKAQALIQSDIKYYTPKAEDLAWPGVIVAANKPRTGIEIREKDTVSRIFKTNLTQQETWYPTVRKTVWILSQLHDFVKPAIFEDIAQEAALLCCQSLLAARDLINARPPASTPLDGHLFLVRHMLILKDVAKSLEGEGPSQGSYPQKELSMGGFPNAPKSAMPRTPGTSMFGYGAEPSYVGGVTGTLTTMLNRTTAILPEGLFASLGVTRGDESIRDAKHGIDLDLRRACEDVINASVVPLCAPIDEWVMRVQTFSSGSAGKPGTSTRTAPNPPSTSTRAGTANSAGGLDLATLSNPDHVVALYTEFRSAVERDLRANVSRIKLYLGDADSEPQSVSISSTYQASASGAGPGAPQLPLQHGRTAKILIDHIRERVTEAYQGFVDQLREAVQVQAGGSASGEDVQRLLKEMDSNHGGVKEVIKVICLGDLSESRASGSGGR